MAALILMIIIVGFAGFGAYCLFSNKTNNRISRLRKFDNEKA